MTALYSVIPSLYGTVAVAARRIFHAFKTLSTRTQGRNCSFECHAQLARAIAMRWYRAKSLSNKKRVSKELEKQTALRLSWFGFNYIVEWRFWFREEYGIVKARQLKGLEGSNASHRYKVLASSVWRDQKSLLILRCLNTPRFLKAIVTTLTFLYRKCHDHNNSYLIATLLCQMRFWAGPLCSAFAPRVYSFRQSWRLT